MGLGVNRFVGARDLVVGLHCNRRVKPPSKTAVNMIMYSHIWRVTGPTLDLDIGQWITTASPRF